jgi:hypothetical protein
MNMYIRSVIGKLDTVLLFSSHRVGSGTIEIVKTFNKLVKDNQKYINATCSPIRLAILETIGIHPSH